MDTQHKRAANFKKNYGMVDGKSVFLGNRYDQRVDSVTGSMWQIIIRDTFQYVPLLKVIELLLNDKSIYNDVVYGHASCDAVMMTFVMFVVSLYSFVCRRQECIAAMCCKLR